LSAAENLNSSGNKKALVSDSEDQNDATDSLDNSNANSRSGTASGSLSKKKKQYIEQKIEDKTGVFTY
jgi:hypothetical protein